jgi:hypothetical protein
LATPASGASVKNPDFSLVSFADFSNYILLMLVARHDFGFDFRRSFGALWTDHRSRHEWQSS